MCFFDSEPRESKFQFSEIASFANPTLLLGPHEKGTQTTGLLDLEEKKGAPRKEIQPSP
jgi:hypothetical protein